ncbi:NAD(P)-dependent dehydrogenase, short-chain alcohol dehydrogenase family [Tistlia consotensis]|uniref:NAD(P)-dependent dehydrogenase, short-chain alcohol dehydrogenase family n=1 Tax=Tistlia consotensis USBA 355 TaxID=560819 RepID=A0A1Y6BFM3_9PROT|nr:SDR family oxidoreductase [Tistlia consotensis]SMF05275.1 NAD(P)-dependent dehydrogenase, short-chain alcohol dehydrogenase family [Tistlia consotensis USBA 355]SNR55186.1 NAD(P)-dependent dehydrogenase, short-chain alcohol dehydrogenase family [Tistlia consotensis]
MQIDLSGKTAVVTASTAGIGYASARGLAAAGAQVVVNGRSQHAVDQAIAKLEREVSGARLSGWAGDLATAEGCAAIVEAVPAPDILVNNLGVYGPQDFFEVEDAEWQRFLETNLLSGVRLSRAWLPGMVERGWGRVLFVSSESGRNIPADMIHYGVTKTAQLALSRGLAKRVAGSGVTVNAVLPGPTLTEGVAEMLADQASEQGRSLDEVAADFVLSERPSSIIRRAATPEEVANMIVYLCSPQASATTGAALRVDGGVVDDIV